MQPILKWAGGKRQLIKKIIELIKVDGHTYYEPFVGGGAVCFNLEHPNSVINDTNSELINVYKTIRDNPSELISALRIHESNYSASYYYKIRGMDRKKNYANLDNVTRAARIIFLNKTCYNGLYRVNSKGEFNVPVGRYNKPKILDESRIVQLSNLLNKPSFIIMNEDFSLAVKNAREGDVVYFDPPYDYDDENGFTSYCANGFDRKELTRLRDLSLELIKRGCKVIISNNDTQFVNQVFCDSAFTIHHIEANRYIGSKSSSRKKVGEVIIYGQK